MVATVSVPMTSLASGPRRKETSSPSYMSQQNRLFLSDVHFWIYQSGWRGRGGTKNVTHWLVKSGLYVKLAGVLGFGLCPEPHGLKMWKAIDLHMSPEGEKMDGSTQTQLLWIIEDLGFVILIYCKNLCIVYGLPFDVGLCLLTCGS